jgi:hypothetical protein
VRFEQAARGRNTGHTPTVTIGSSDASARCANGW